MSTVSKHLSNNYNNAITRLVLFICRQQTQEEADVDLLFCMLQKKFEGRKSLYCNLHEGPFREVIVAWRKQLTTSIHRTTCTSTYFLCVEDECAYVNRRVLDHQGNVLEFSPYKIAYESKDPEPLLIAKELQPKMPCEWEKKFINRDICNELNYTFIRDAKNMCFTENYGILEYLVETLQEKDKEVIQISCSILGKLCSHTNLGTCFSVIMAFLKKGIEILNIVDKNLSCPIFELFEKLYGTQLEELLHEIRFQIVPLDKRLNFEKHLIHTLTRRCFCKTDFSLILDFCCSCLQIQQKEQDDWKFEIMKQIDINKNEYE